MPDDSLVHPFGGSFPRTATRAAKRPYRPGLRAFALLLILAVAIPLGAILISAIDQSARRDKVQATEEVRRLARIAASEAEMLLVDTQHVLEQAARRNAGRPLDASRCEALLAAFRMDAPQIVSVAAFDADGRFACERPVLPQLERDPSIMRQALLGARVAIGAPRVAGSPGSWLVPVAVRVPAGDGQAAPVIVGRLDVARFGSVALNASDLAPGAVIELVDEQGRVLAASGPDADVGRIAHRDLVREALAQRRSSLRGQVIDGRDDAVGYAALASVPWVAVVSMPADHVLAFAKKSARHSTAAMVAVVALLLAGGAFGVRFLLLPIRSIAAVASAVARGDLDARVRVSGPREVADIGLQINRMLDERKRDEATLRASEARFRQLFETSADAIVIVDRDLRIVVANPATLDVFGYHSEELAGVDLGLLQPTRLRRALRDRLGRHLQAGSPRVHRRGEESVGLRADGREIPIEVTFSHMHVDGADVFAAYIRDISRRKRAEAELRESEARFREIADAAPAMIWMADAMGACVYVNRPWLAFTGSTPDRERGDGWIAHVHPDDADLCRSTNEAAFRDNTPFTIEFRLRRSDGQFRFVLNHGVPRIARDGALLGFVGTCIDIHDRVVAEQRNRRLSTLYAALSHANEAIARTRDPRAMLQRICEITVGDGGFQTAWIGMLDAERRRMRSAAAAGATFDHYDRLDVALDGPDPHRMLPALAAVLDGRHAIDDGAAYPAALPHAASAAPPRSIAALPLRRGGHVVGVLYVHAREASYFDTELTELVRLLAEDLSFALDRADAEERHERAERALRQLNATLEDKVEARTRSLEAANRELEAFSYSVSHDLRAPLRAISGFTELVLEASAERIDGQALGYLRRVQAASGRMSRLISDLLDLSRVARAEPVRSHVDVTQLASDTLAELRDGEPQRRVEVTIAPGLVAHADRGLLQILLANLLGNAWKFTARREDASIEFGADERLGRGAFFVRDNGAGFDMAHAGKLFVPFQRLHSEREFAGTGIGLAIVQRIAQRHGGDVRAESVEGAGTTVVFSLGTEAGVTPAGEISAPARSRQCLSVASPRSSAACNAGIA